MRQQVRQSTKILIVSTITCERISNLREQDMAVYVYKITTKAEILQATSNLKNLASDCRCLASLGHH